MNLVIAPWLRGYDRRWLTRDVVGGLATGAVVIPQAMAYATVANLPVEVGLYTCMVPMAVYALLGGSRALSVSTTSTIAILTASTMLSARVAAETPDAARSLATLTLLVGVILLVARALHIGGVIDNISEATLTGVKVGVGLTVAAGQLPSLLGVPGDPDAKSFFAELRGVARHLDQISWTTTVFSACTIALLLLLRRLAPQFPAPLLAVGLGIGLVALTSIEDHGLSLVGKVPSGLPTPVAPELHHIGPLIPGALAIAMMVFLETLAVGRAVRRPSEPPIDNDQELLASGLSCALGALFRAMPAAGGFSQTAINQRSGSRTQLSELVTVGLAIACALFLGGVLGDLPSATLACLVVLAVLGLIEPKAFVRFWSFNRIEFWVATLTAACGLIFGLLAAVLAGVILTLLLVVIELDRIDVTELQPTEDGLDVEVAGATTASLPGLLVLRFDGPLYTANIRPVNRKILAAVDGRPGTKVLVLDGTSLGQPSTTIVLEATNLEHELAERGVEVWIAALPPRALAATQKLPRWDEFVQGERVYPTALAAVTAFRNGANR
jgi:high affinity sulfate transporter 1